VLPKKRSHQLIKKSSYRSVNIYISEKKDEVFANLKKNIKISKENIPAATQLFTPKWIVKYMVENSLGKLWLESHPNEELKAQWKYYLEEAEQEPEVQKQLEELKNPNLNPIEIKVLDPCCGSGHILVYAFEVLYEIYKSYGYMEEDIPKVILENNLYGLDIDDRAAQLASFAVMMKARSKSQGVFRENIRLNICAIQESNWMGNEVRDILVDREGMELKQNREKNVITYLTDTFKDAKEYGSILDVRELDLEFLEQRLDEVSNSVSRDLWEVSYRDVILEKLPGVILQAKIMGAKYDVVCTNPPYMGNRGIDTKLGSYLTNNYPNSKSDLCVVFIEKCLSYSKVNCFVSMVTMHSWMFVSSFGKFRSRLIKTTSIDSILHLGMEAFEGIIGKIVATVAFSLKNVQSLDRKITGIRLVDYYDSRRYEKEDQFFNIENKYSNVIGKDLEIIPGAPIAYWISPGIINAFKTGTMLCEYAIAVTKGIFTGNNERFIRLWYEVDFLDVIRNKWHYYSKGGPYRKWYGNSLYVINWENDARELKSYSGSGMGAAKFYGFPHIVWSGITTVSASFRYDLDNVYFDDVSPAIIIEKKDILALIGFLNTKIVDEFLKIIAPTIHYQIGDIKKIPLKDITAYVRERLEGIVEKTIANSKADWNAFEASWDFEIHPLLKHRNGADAVEQAFLIWFNFAETQFNHLRANEEELNRIFIDIYGLQDELTPEVEDKDITIRKADQERDIKSFISYAVGCMLGRYSLDEEGLVFAGGKFDPERYKTFKADADGILPVLSDAYFDDDIVTQLVEFVKVTFGENTLATNLDYIAETLGRKANESSRERIRRYFLKDFYKDHVQMYKKRPIYWLFTSGKEQGFNALVYMHRYDSSMVSRVRTDYLHPLQNKLEAEYLRLNSVLVSEDSPTEKTKATKRLKELTKQMDELKKYDEVIHNLADQQIEIDLDDGVVVNYAKFEKVLAKI